MSEKTSSFRMAAERHFAKARTEAKRERFLSWLTGREERTLLPFDEIRAELRDEDARCVGLIQIPVERIVGSVGRYNDFTREFLPLKDELRERWVNLEADAWHRDWPPIDVYGIGDAYFVIDGNHRVAVARQLGREMIAAHVWVLAEDLNLDTEQSLDELLIQLGRRHFLQQTALDEHDPHFDLELTTPGQYKELLAQINQWQKLMERIDDEPMSCEDAAAAWYDMVYLPGTLIIEESGLLDNFPGRTPADLLVWFSRHRKALLAHYGDYDHLSELLEQVSEDQQATAIRRVTRQVMKLMGREFPAALPPEPGG